MLTTNLMIGYTDADLRLETFLETEPLRDAAPAATYVVACWAGWSGSGRDAIPQLAALKRTYPDMRVIAVGQDGPGPVASFVVEEGDEAGFPVTVPRIAPDGMPTAFILDGARRVVWSGDPGSIEPVLASLVAGSRDLPAAGDAGGALAASDGMGMGDCFIRLGLLLDRNWSEGLTYSYHVAEMCGADDPDSLLRIGALIATAAETPGEGLRTRMLAARIVELLLPLHFSQVFDGDRTHVLLRQTLARAFLANGNAAPARVHAEEALARGQTAGLCEEAMNGLRELLRRCEAPAAITGLPVARTIARTDDVFGKARETAKRGAVSFCL